MIQGNKATNEIKDNYNFIWSLILTGGTEKFLNTFSTSTRGVRARGVNRFANAFQAISPVALQKSA